MEIRTINVTDITEYLYCPRKVYFRLFKGLKSPPSQKMILGFLRHKVLENFSKNEYILVSSIDKKISEQEIKRKYELFLNNLLNEALFLNENLIKKFKIQKNEFYDSVKKSAYPEIQLRVDSIAKTLEKGFTKQELWEKLSPKYASEFKIESKKLGLRGKIDRIKLGKEILPYEIKSRENSFESDKIQLAAYSLLLEDYFKIPIPKGVIELLGKKEEIILDNNLKNNVLEIADKIRHLGENPPPILSNFNKCRTCNFKEEC